MATEITREQIVAEARAWIGTPYHHQASLKGVGADCLGLVRGVWCQVTGDTHEDPPPYTQDWAEATGKELMRDAARRYLDEVDITGMQKPAILSVLYPGDVVLFRMLERGPAKHCGFVAKDGGVLTLIHAWNQQSFKGSKVEEVAFDAGWVNRIAYAFRFKGL